MELIDLKVADEAADKATAEEVVIKEVESGFDKLTEDNQKTEKKEVDQVASKVDALEDAIITIAKVETNEALDKDAAEEPLKALDDVAASASSKAASISKIHRAAVDQIKSV